jgi:DNA repair exonuclease SbcCD nuclease subunit
MTKIHLHSDLHLEFADIELPGGDLLILAGDIAVADYFGRDGEYRNRFVNFLRRCGNTYNQVLYIPGNHEHYRGNLSKSIEKITPYLPKNVFLSDRGVFEYNDWVFLLTTLWTDFNKENPITLQLINSKMNDFRVIRYGDTYDRFTPYIALKEHKESKDWLKNKLAEYKNRNVFVVSHHAPSFESVPEEYKHDFHMNGGYVSDLSNLILDNPQIKYWAHGHIHTCQNYKIGDTTIIANPRGYVGNEKTDYDLNFSLEI